MTREEIEMRTLVRESDVIDKTDGSELAKAFNHLWEKYVEQEPCGDAIRRADAEALFRNARSKLNPSDYKTADEFNTRDLMLLNAEQFIHMLPSVKPQEPKTGHWKVVSDGYGDNAYICECSECEDTVWVYKDANRKWNYCPNCGVKMIEPQESEEVNDTDK